MKKLWICMVVILLSLLPLSCSKAEQPDSVANQPDSAAEQSDAVATDFLKKLYSVDTNELSAMNNIEKLSGDPDSLNQVNASLESLHEKFKSDITDSAYQSMFKNRTYSFYLVRALDNNYTLQSKNISLSKTSGSDTAVQYSYTATIELTYLDDKEQKEITECGVVQETKESQWKINYIDATASDFWSSSDSQS